MRIPALLLLTLPLLASCGKKPGSYATAEGSGDSAVEGILSAADEAWASRDDAAALEAALAKYEEAHTADPTNRHALVQLTRGWYFFGDAHAPDKDAQIERWGKAIEYGKKCQALNKEFADKVNSGEKEKDAVSVATKDDVPCLYWLSTALGKWAKGQSLSKTLKYLPTVKAFMSKTEELDPTYFNYGPARYWGAYYAVLPSFAGQDPVKSKEYFEATIAGAPYYLPSRALRAEFLSVLTADVKAFDEDLNFIINADPATEAAVAHDVVAENKMEIAKAKALLAKKNELFDKKTLEAAGQ